MLIKVDGSSIEDLKDVKLNMRQVFVEISARISSSTPVYYIFYKNNSPEVAFALYEKNNKIILPNHYPYYSGIWLKSNSESNSDFLEAVTLLKAKYLSIELIVPICISDIRGFMWNEFKVELRYTYIKKCNDNDFERNVNKNYRKSIEELSLILEIEKINNDHWGFYSKLLQSIKFDIKSSKQLKAWNLELENENLIKLFVIRNSEGEIQGSGLVLLDLPAKCAGFLLSYVPKSKVQSQINAFLYVEIHKWLASNGYLYFDYLGANTQNISKFKSRFKPDLKHYYVVRCHKNDENYRDFFLALKKQIIFYLKKIAKFLIKNYILFSQMFKRIP